MGADPECQVLGDKTKLSSDLVLETILRNNCDTRFGEIGDDHNSILEFRPKPGSPEGVADNIGGMIKIIGAKAPYLNLSTLAYYSAVGGHIHLEIPKDFPKDKPADRHDLGKPQIKAIKQISKALGAFYLPIMMSENKVSWKKRLDHGYGSFENYSECRDGALRLDTKGTWPDGTSLYTIEFRTPSAEWIMSEKIAKATLCYIATVYYQCLKHPQSIKKISKLFWQTNAQAKAFQDLVITEHKLMTKTYLDHISHAIRRFELYPQYKAEIEYILNYEQAFKDKVALDYNPMAGWKAKGKLGSYTAKAAQKKLKSPESGAYECLLTEKIIYNSDLEVERFTKALAKSVYNAKAELKNNYCLFGIREGIDDIFAVKTIHQENTSNLMYLLNGQLPQITDCLAIHELFLKMDYKFRSNCRDDKNKDTILIAIPYKLRMNHEYGPILDLVAKLEGGKGLGPLLLKPETSKGMELGIIFKAFYPDISSWEEFQLNQRMDANVLRSLKSCMSDYGLTIANWGDPEKKEQFTSYLKERFNSSTVRNLTDYLSAKHQLWQESQKGAETISAE